MRGRFRVVPKLAVVSILIGVPISADATMVTRSCPSAPNETIELSVANDLMSGNDVEVFVRAASTHPVDYNEYYQRIPNGEAYTFPMSGFEYSDQGVGAVQVTIRELVDDGDVAPPCVEVVEFRCPEEATNPILEADEDDVHRKFAEGGLRAVATGSPLGTRVGNESGACPDGEVSSGLYLYEQGGATNYAVTGVMHAKYICTSTPLNNFADRPSPCCGDRVDGPGAFPEGCCYGDGGDLCASDGNPGTKDCLQSPLGTWAEEKGVAIESSHLLTTLEPGQCANNDIKGSPRLTCANIGEPRVQTKYPECCDADDEDDFSDTAIATCAGMVITHVEIVGQSRELRRPFWTSYAMDSEVGLTWSDFDGKDQRYVSPEELKFDCLDFTVPEVAPSTPDLNAQVGWTGLTCDQFIADDTDYNGIHDACQGSEAACIADADCDDCRFCNSVETCIGGCLSGLACAPGEYCSEELDACFECLWDGDCSDSLFCNGEETCNEVGECVGGGPATCSATEVCDEFSDACVTPPACPATTGCGPFGCKPTRSCTTTNNGETACLDATGQIQSCPGGIEITHCDCSGKKGVVCRATNQTWRCLK